MEQEQLPDNLAVVEQTVLTDNVPTKPVFGFGAINHPTPAWANWVFRVVFLLTTVLASYLAATNLFSVNQKYEITLFLKVLIDPLAWGLSRMCGIKVDMEEVKKRIEDNKNN